MHAAAATPTKSSRLCYAAECDRQVEVKGLCYSHYRRQMRGKDISTPIAERGLVEVTSTRVNPDVAAKLNEYADTLGITQYALVQKILTEWAANA